YNNLIEDCPVGFPCGAAISVKTGTAPFTWTATGLPPGMSIRFGATMSNELSPGDAEIWGNASTAGNYNVQLTVTDATGATATNTFPFHISELGGAEGFRDGTIGVAYSGRVRLVGGTPGYTVTQVGGRLPAGLTLHADGTLDGTPLENGDFK